MSKFIPVDGMKTTIWTQENFHLAKRAKPAYRDRMNRPKNYQEIYVV